WSGAPLEFDATALHTAAGQRVSVSRLDLLLSNVALRRAGGGWLGTTNWSTYVGSRAGATRSVLTNLPPGDYDAIRFHIGLPPDRNHADPAAFAPADPLNPTLNGLHWNWQGGY